MKVLITDGAGFIGSSLAHKLVENDEEVTIIDDLSMGRLENLLDIRNRISFYKHTVCDKEFMHHLLMSKHFDYIWPRPQVLLVQ